MLLHRRQGRSLPIIGAARRLLLGFSPTEAEFERRGFFLGHAGVRRAAEDAARYAIEGYGIALELGDPSSVGARLDMLNADQRPYAYEGAAIGLTTLDALRPGFGDRHLRFLAGPAQRYLFPAQAGVGMALGASGRDHRKRLVGLDPFSRWMVADGYGFFCGHTRTRRTIGEQRVPSRVEGRERPCFDAGVGRALWFVECGDPPRLAQAIAGFDERRRPALWSGVAVAATFLGGADADHLQALRRLAGAHERRLVRGVALAVAIFERAGVIPAHVELVCQELCDTRVDVVASRAREARAQLDELGDEAWESWRSRTEELLSRPRQVT